VSRTLITMTMPTSRYHEEGLAYETRAKALEL
jgi:hypothetical protein